MIMLTLKVGITKSTNVLRLYDVNKFIAYKLNEMKMVTETVEYTIEFYVVKTSDGWTVSSLSTSDLEKIHGIYDYES